MEKIGSWLDRFPDLAGLGDDERRLLAARVQETVLPAGTVLFSPGSPCELYLLVLDGSIRVQMLADNGREILLYRVGPGQSCLLTAASLVAGEPYAAEGVTERATRAVVLPHALFDRLLASSEVFRRFVFAGFGHRVAGILDAMQSALFLPVDRRLARRLTSKATHAVTHRDLAAELGTAREVVSRQLELFERRGLIRRRRGVIEVIDAASLARLAEGRD